ncbi:MAG: hypothetical protein PHD08_07575 [Synergistaceae bacterium]|nr:hypothetical protein [Synergistaceae bacterium]
MRDYFYFKKEVLKRCLNMPPRLGSICKGEISDVFVRAMRSFHLMAKGREMNRLKKLEKYIVKTYFADGFYMTISKLQALIGSFNRSTFRRYRSRTGAGTSIEIEYRIKKDTVYKNGEVRGIEAYITNGRNKISVRKLGALTALAITDPNNKETLDGMLKKSYPGLEGVLNISLTGDLLRLQSESGKQISVNMEDEESISISCPEDILNFITDEIMLYLTSTFIGRNIAFEEIREMMDGDIKKVSQQAEPEL